MIAIGTISELFNLKNTAIIFTKKNTLEMFLLVLYCTLMVQ